MSDKNSLQRVIEDLDGAISLGRTIATDEIKNIRQRLAALSAQTEARDGWQKISTLPHTGEVVLFYIAGKRPCMNRADDFHTGFAHWLDGATHWQFLPSPPIERKANGMD